MSFKLFPIISTFFHETVYCSFLRHCRQPQAAQDCQSFGTARDPLQRKRFRVPAHRGEDQENAGPDPQIGR